MFCGSCGKEIDNHARFCPYCGAQTAAPQQAPVQPVRQTSPVQTAAPVQQNEAQPTAPASKTFGEVQQTTDVSAKKKGKFKFLGGRRKEKPAENSAKEKKRPKLPEPTPGVSLLTAFVLMECLPYLLRSLIMLLTGTVLPTTLSCLCGIVGFAAAGAILMLFSRLCAGRAPLASALLFTSLFAAYRTTLPFVLAQTHSGVTLRGVIFYGAAAVLTAAAAAALVAPLSALFVSDDKKHGGRLAAFICVLLGFAAPGLLQTGLFFVTIESTPSFMGTFSFKLLAAALEAGMFTLAANAMVKSLKSKPANEPKRFGSLIAGGVFAAASVIALFLGSGAQSVVTTASNDVLEPLVNGELLLSNGDMTLAAQSFRLAGEHAKAWTELAQGNSYSVPDEFINDPMLNYLSFVNGGSNALSKYLIDNFNADDIGIFGPLMLQYYDDIESLSETQEAHRREVIDLCIGSESFENVYPSMKAIEKNSGELMRLSATESVFSKELRLAELYSAGMKGDDSASSSVKGFLDLAEEYPDDIKLQLTAAIIGSENRWDSAGHYERTAEAILRFLRIWNDTYSADADEEEYLTVQNSAASMLMNVNEFGKAASLLEETNNKIPGNKNVMQKLSRCYSETGENDKSYDLARTMYKEFPDDVTVLWSLCVSALQKGRPEEAIEAAAALADVVKADDSGKEPDGDSLLFNCVTYLAYTNATCGFDNRVYDGEDTDKLLLPLFEKHPFLHDYVRAVYYEKQKSEPEKALPYVESALKENGDLPRLLYLKGIILYNTKDFEGSEEALLKADNLSPNDLSILYALANTYDAMKRYDEAYELCSRVIEMYPNGADHSEDVYGVQPHAAALKGSLEAYISKGGE